MTQELYATQDDALSLEGCTVDELVGRLKTGASRISCSGLHGSALAFVVARAMQAQPNRPMVVVAPDRKRAYRLFEDLSFYAGEHDLSHQPERLHWYPADEMLPYSEMLPDRGAIQTRLGGLMQLQLHGAPVFVMPVSALMRKVLPTEVLSSHSDLLQMAEEIDREQFIEHLVRGGYQRVDVVEDRGSFSVRGSILDVFPPLYKNPVRIELDDDLIESLRFFDPTNQRTLEEIEEILIGPVDEVLNNERTLMQARLRLASLADDLHYSTLELQQLLQDLHSGLRPFGLQALMPGFYPELATLQDYLPSDTLFLLDDPSELSIESRRYFERMEHGYQDVLEHGHLAFAPNEFLQTWEEIEESAAKFSRIEHHSILTLDPHNPDAQTMEKSAQKSFLDARGRLVFPYNTRNQQALRNVLQSLPPTQERRLQPLVDELHNWQEHRMRVLLVCGSKGQALRLKELLRLYDVEARLQEDPFALGLLERRDQREHKVDILIGRITEGVIFPRAGFVLVSEEEIFGAKTRRKRSNKKRVMSSELTALKVGDFLIHKTHGVAQFGGLHTITVEGITGDFLLLNFRGKDKLYLSVTSIHLVERYSGGGSPSLDRLKGNSFEKKKAKARKSVESLAGELIRLYAVRQAQKGLQLPAPAEEYYQFEARFPFEETPDQARAIEDVLTDLQSEGCTDRLICGDVGFGKTEVAMRAAFMAAFSGHQVAVLVPTTVLAQQHGLSFTERFEGCPLRIEVLSRFQDRATQKRVLKEVGEGKVDILIGTHRLLSKDVKFTNLGLLIIDEEQRFGVRHKEQIKRLREQMVEVITLTATPIPRTLEMSMMGVRDLSLIKTPPHDRLAIRTIVAPWGEQVIRESVMRELGRGGQVFFLHNRVENMGEMQTRLQQIVPEARIVVAHGQMPEGELERVMLDFVQGKYNLLLCTSIIESGLDIPRANTILVNRADNFGLSQLYQIRGRVGRGRERAYAYLLVPAAQRITPEAKERLATLQRFTELGAGFEIARHDLEMRGAGNILGKEQSGHIHAIGIDLYLEMLQETIDELLGRSSLDRIEPEIKLGIEAYIPEQYVPDMQLRLQCYRRISMSESVEELDELAQEFWDRFGQPPVSVERLLQLQEIKQMVTLLHGVTAEIARGRFRVFLHDEAPVDLPRILQQAQKPDTPFRLLPHNGFEMSDELPSDGDSLGPIRSFLRQLPPLVFAQDGPVDTSKPSAMSFVKL
jgi:transcription-repair coupling factor (superfamily II helicase)